MERNQSGFMSAKTRQHISVFCSSRYMNPTRVSETACTIRNAVLVNVLP